MHDPTFGLNWFRNLGMQVKWTHFQTHQHAASRAGAKLIHGFITRVARGF